MISIIMPSFNQAKFIEHAIDSVFNQKTNDIELVISDGGSTDGTLDILVQKSSQYENLSWVSEADTGPAQALNKALNRSKGTIIGWLNSDDSYIQNIIDDIHDYFSRDPNMILVYGQGQYIDSENKFISHYPTLDPSAGLDNFKSGCFICQPTVFFKRSLFLMQGGLNEDLQASFDYEYWIRAFINFQNRIGFLDKDIAQSRLHSESITHRFRATVAEEGALLCSRYFGTAPIHWVVTYIEELQKERSVRFSDFSKTEQKAIFRKFETYCDGKQLKELRDAIS